MADTSERSVDDIKRETEATRARLTTTVDELRSTVSETVADIKQHLSPTAVKAEVNNYVRTRGETMLHDLTEAARRNPMQAVAIGVGVAYPLLKIARAVPLPLVVIGAGYFLAGTERGRDMADQATGMMSNAADQAREQVGSLRQQATQSVDAAKDYVSDTLDSLKDASPFKSTSSGTSDASMMDSLRSKASDAPRRAQDMFGTAQGQAQYASRRANEAIRQNPFLIAGAGLLFGALIASAIPKLQIEDDLMGDASSGLKERAQEAASQGFDQAKNKASDMLSNIADTADKEGLSGAGLSDGVHDIEERLRRVAERGVDTALGRDNTGNTTTEEGNRHG
jgi:ElaB/YqjD/DUF883 family membrane-anchored ribosome-binding protein